MACEARNYHQGGVVVENSLVRNSKVSKEGFRKLKEKEESAMAPFFGVMSV